ncbi:MAG: hypothetical protein C4297_06905 [Gemmataceae bacterium]
MKRETRVGLFLAFGFLVLFGAVLGYKIWYAPDQAATSAGPTGTPSQTGKKDAAPLARADEPAGKKEDSGRVNPENTTGHTQGTDARRATEEDTSGPPVLNGAPGPADPVTPVPAASDTPAPEKHDAPPPPEPPLPPAPREERSGVAAPGPGSAPAVPPRDDTHEMPATDPAPPAAPAGTGSTSPAESVRPPAPADVPALPDASGASVSQPPRMPALPLPSKSPVQRGESSAPAGGEGRQDQAGTTSPPAPALEDRPSPQAPMPAGDAPHEGASRSTSVPAMPPQGPPDVPPEKPSMAPDPESKSGRRGDPERWDVLQGKDQLATPASVGAGRDSGRSVPAQPATLPRPDTFDRRYDPPATLGRPVTHRATGVPVAGTGTGRGAETVSDAGIPLQIRNVPERPHVRSRDVPLVPTPAAPRTPTVRSFDVRIHQVQPGDSYERVSQLYYDSPRLAQALAAFNRDRDATDAPLAPGRKLYIPPREYLEAESSGSGGYASAPDRRPAGTAMQAAPGTGAQAARAGSSDATAGAGPSASTQAARPSAVSRPAPAASGGYKTYRVQPQDTIWSIAKRTLGRGERWPEIARLNRDLLPDVNRLQPGMTLRLPADAVVEQEQ